MYYVNSFERRGKCFSHPHTCEEGNHERRESNTLPVEKCEICMGSGSTEYSYICKYVNDGSGKNMTVYELYNFIYEDSSYKALNIQKR